MTSSPLLSFETFLAPLPRGGPGDPTVFRDLRGELDGLIREDDPQSFPKGDPRCDKPRKADWQGVVNRTQECLAKHSRDLRIAAWLTVGLAQTERFAGLRDGLHLLNLLVNDSWDNLNPPFDAHEPGERTESLSDILNEDRGEPRLPGRIRLIPLIRGERQAYGAYHLGQDPGVTSLDRDDINLARSLISLEECQALGEDIAQSLQELDSLEKALIARSPSRPSTLKDLRSALQECHAIVEEVKKGKIVPGQLTQTSRVGTARAGERAVIAVGDVEGARSKVYEQLLESADLLEHLESKKSPIPTLLRKAVRWGQMSFVDLHQARIMEILIQVATHPDSKDS
jgi:type VI secretion system ImpA family protein